MKSFYILKKNLIAFFLVVFFIAGEAKPLSINAPLTASFSANPSSGCAPLSVAFINSSSGATSYSWNFGDPSSGALNTSTSCSPTHVFMTPGTYTVTLIAGSSTATLTVTVLPSPTPVITGPNPICNNLNGTYSTPGAPLHTYSWTVTGGNIVGASNNPSVNILWNTTGTQLVTVTETAGNGCSGTKTFPVNVRPTPEFLNTLCNKVVKRSNGTTPAGGNPKDSGSNDFHCFCAFDYDTLEIEQTDVDPITWNDNLAVYTWTITGGTIISGQGTKVLIVQWGAGPTATINCVVTNRWGCTDSETCIVDICPSPIANFTTIPGCVNSPVLFNASTSIGNPGISEYIWNFGDNSPLVSTANPVITHPYATAGNYTVILTVVGSNGCTGVKTLTLTISNGLAPEIKCVSTVCHNTSHWYYTQFYSGATYNWVVTGFDLANPPSFNGNMDSIYITWGNGPQGTITLNVTGGPYTCGSTTVTVPVFPANIIIIPSLSIACSGSPITFTAPLIPGTFYNWQLFLNGVLQPSVFNNNTNATNSNNVLFYNVPVGVVGFIDVKLNMNNKLICCSGDSGIRVNIRPHLNILGDILACPDGSIHVYSVSPVLGATFLWGVSASGTIIGSNTGNTINVAWNSAGPGTVTVTVTSTLNPYCNSIAALSVTVYPPPTPFAITGPGTICKATTNTYMVPTQTTPFVVNTTWSVFPLTGVVITGSGNSRSITFNTAGCYTITVNYQYATNPPGCKSTNTMTVLVFPTTLPMSATPAVCVNSSPQTYTANISNPACLTSTLSTNFAQYYTWQVSGGSVVSTNQNQITIQWGNTDIGYFFLLNTICGTIQSFPVTINAIPSVAITASNLPCFGTPSPSITLTAQAGPGITYSWAANPGIVSSSGGVAVVNALSTYTVTATNAAGCSISQSFIVTSLTLPQIPVSITQTLIGTCFKPVGSSVFYDVYYLTATFNANYNYSWTNNLSGVTSSTNIATAISNGAVWTLTVTDVTTGCTRTITHTMPVHTYIICTGGGNGNSSCQHCPGVALSFVFNPCTGQFTNTSTGAQAGSYFWDFGDGGSSFLDNPLHIYNFTGTYTVTMWANSASNPSCRTCSTFTVSPIVINPRFTFSTVGCNYLQYNFNANTTNGFSPLSSATYQWNITCPFPVFSFSSPATSSTLLTQTFPAAGTYTVTLTVSKGGCSKSVTQVIIVRPLIAAFVNCGNCTNRPIQFLDQSTGPNAIVSWQWNFGDGSPLSYLQSPFHQYFTPGPKLVTLMVTDANGCTSTISTVINVATFNPGLINLAGINRPNYYIQSICYGSNVTAIAPAGYSYTWSNGVTGTNTQIFSTSGMYYVDVKDGSDCIARLTFFIVEMPSPDVIIMGNTIICLFDFDQALATIEGSGYTYQWKIDGNAASTTSLLENFWWGSYTPGTHIVTVAVTNMFGCTNTASVTITLNFNQFNFITASPFFFCPGDSSVLTATSGFTSYLWSTGAVTQSITVYFGGTYTCIGTTANGCTSKGSVTVTQLSAPDVSIIPQGCYKVCDTQLKDTLSIPNPLPVNINSNICCLNKFKYEWYQNGILFSTTISPSPFFTIPGPGSYYVVVTDLTTGCKTTSAPFDIDSVNVPQPTIIIIGNESVICRNYGNSVTLQANPTGFAYQWFFNGNPIPFATSPTVMVNNPGVYTLRILINNCCYKETKIVIEGVENCCANPNDKNVVFIGPSSPLANITSSQFFYSQFKYFVTDNTIITVSGNTTTLDLTNVDILFGKCAGIDFVKGAKVRANNSVFRPCDLNSTWRGFGFYDTDSNIIDESLFKNAQKGLYFEHSIGRVTNNQFHDNQIGVQVYGVNNFNEAITGNTFIIDNLSDLIDYEALPCYVNIPFNNEHFGVYSSFSFHTGVISQNDFVNGITKANSPRYLTGVHLNNGSANITKNNFTNQWTAIEILNNDANVLVENNEIEYNRNISVNKSAQIYCNATGNIAIVGNTLTSTPNEYPYAIYAINGYSTLIKSNTIDGFIDGILIDSMNTTSVNSNIIKNCSHSGIFAGSSNTTDISCNDLDMYNFNNPSSGGIPLGIFIFGLDQSCRIYTNCVKNTETAIFLIAPNTFSPMPIVVNNFLFNYYDNGVYVKNYSGVVGVNGRNGGNSFIDNRVSSGTTFDIQNGGGGIVSQGGNFASSALVLAGVATVNSATTPSTAACALQTYTIKPKANFDAYPLCDDYNTRFSFLEGGDLIIKKLDGISPQNILMYSEMAVADLLINSRDKDASDVVLHMLGSNKLTAFEKAELQYRYYINTGHEGTARDIIERAVPENMEQENARMLKLLHCDILSAAVAEGFMNPAIQKNLNDIIATDAKNKITAKELLALTAKVAPNETRDLPKVAYAPAPNRADITRSDLIQVNVFPNPANNILNVNYITGIEDKCFIEILDLAGKVVTAEELEFEGGVHKLDISMLSKGMYMVTIKSQSVIIGTAKFVKE